MLTQLLKIVGYSPLTFKMQAQPSIKVSLLFDTILKFIHSTYQVKVCILKRQIIKDQLGSDKTKKGIR